MGKKLRKHHYWNTVQCLQASFMAVLLLLVIFALANCSQVNQGETRMNSENNIQMDAPKDADIRVNNKVSQSVNDIEQESKVRSKPIQKRHVSGDKVPCQPLPRELLRKILGPAYNPRYMSFDRPDTERSPPGTADSANGKTNQKDQAWTHHNQNNKHGHHKKIEAFHVHEGYTRILHEEPVLLENYFGTRQLDVNLSPSSLMAHKTQGQSLAIATALTKRGSWTHNSKSSSSKKATTVSSTTSAKDDKKPFSSKGHQNYLKMDEFEQVEPAPQEPVIEKNRYKDSENKENKAPDKFLRLIRGKRNVKNGFPWACDSRIEWLDLGANHFPRFLRTVVCTSDKCWFGHFQCRPKAFTVKILRRRKDSCTMPPGSSATGLNDGEVEEEEGIPEGIEDVNSHVPPEFREQWIFEERAVTFCCECAA